MFTSFGSATKRGIASLCTLATLAACDAPSSVSREAQAPQTRPPLASPVAQGACRTLETVPAVYEHVMGEIQVVQGQVAEDGTVIRAPVYRQAPVPRIVRERGEITFDVPCPAQMTPEFIRSVQRALIARGYLSGTVSGTLDARTNASIRRYQTERGLQSAQLSLETARALGLIAVDLDDQAAP